MKDKMNKKDIEKETEAVENETAENKEVETEDNIEENAIDVSSMTEEEAKQTLLDVIGENTELLKELEETKKALESEKADSAKFKDNWYRVAAEFENFKKRNEFTRRNAYDDGMKDAVLPLLSIGDSIDRALAVEMDDKTREGVMLIKRQFTESLAALKVTEIDPKGEIFDPEKAEAIATLPAESDEDDDKVVQVYKKGYELNGKILRYAQVVVHKKS